MPQNHSSVIDRADRSHRSAGQSVLPRVRRSGQTGLHDYAGAVHVHSTCSDGSGTIPEILEAARATGLDYLLLTDHAEDSLCGPEWEAWHDGVLMALGCELSPGVEPHSLAIDLKDIAGLDGLSQTDRLVEVNSRGGYSFIAHPRGHKMLGMNIRPWTEWNSPFITGLEVWSYTYDWLEAFRWSRAISCYSRPHEYISGPHPEVLGMWDRLAMKSRCSGIAGVDAHARPTVFKAFKVFPYDMLFRTTLTHVLVEEFSHDASRDAAAVREALRTGRCYMGYHVVGDPTGFRFVARTASAEVQMGDSVPLAESPVFRVTLPAGGHTRVIVNGRIAGRSYSRDFEFRPTVPGPHRVEVRRQGEPWIFSNHIYVA